MFQRELCRHPDIRTVDYSPHTYLETHHWLKGAVMLGSAASDFVGGHVYPGYGSKANARTYLIDCVRRNVPDFKVPLEDRELIMRGWDALSEKFARPIFFEKSPQLLANWAGLDLFLDWCRSTDYKIKVIGLTRNPMAVQYSAMNLFHTAPEKRQFDWMKGQENLINVQETIELKDFMAVRYEDLIDSPTTGFAAVCDFIGVKSFPKMGTGVHAHSLSKWREDPFFTLQLDPAVSALALELGYTQAEIENPPKPAPPLQHRIRKGLERAYKLTRARIRDRLVRPGLLWIRHLGQ
jgi:hypothetical protein